MLSQLGFKLLDTRRQLLDECLLFVDDGKKFSSRSLSTMWC